MSNFVKLLPALILLVINIVIFLSGYVYLWAVVAMVLAFVFGIGFMGKKKNDYNF